VFELLNADCLDILPWIEDKSVDMVLCDPPYGVTSCEWDIVIPFEPMWKELKRVSKGTICLFGSEPFSSSLRMSNIKDFKYDWIWDKKIPSGMCNAKIMPMRQHEIISIFLSGKNFYYPQKQLRDKPIKSGGNKQSVSGGSVGFKGDFKKTYTHKMPTTLLQFDKIRRGALHPTQKPVELLEYLIKTYTLECQTVLDFTMGSGSTGVACKNLNRKFIGIEKDLKYFQIAEKRING
jgi:DNA modification methylase